MKKYILILSILTVCFGHSVSAQVSVHVNLGLQPDWGPTGYDYAEYYYIPDIDAYYDVNNQQYVYLENNYWVTRPYLPPQYRDFDLYHSYKVVVNEPRPWMYHDRYRAQYAGYRGHYDQRMIRDTRHYGHENYGHDNGWHGQRNEWHGNDRQPRQEFRGREEHGDWHGGEGRGREDHEHEGRGEGGHERR